VASTWWWSPVRFDDEVAIAATVERLGTTSIVTAFRAHRDEELLVEGRLIHVVVDRETYAKRLIPDWVRERLE
jgi:acyl-CoA thioesterase FadM